MKIEIVIKNGESFKLHQMQDSHDMGKKQGEKSGKIMGNREVAKGVG